MLATLIAAHTQLRIYRNVLLYIFTYIHINGSTYLAKDIQTRSSYFHVTFKCSFSATSASFVLQPTLIFVDTPKNHPTTFSESQFPTSSSELLTSSGEILKLLHSLAVGWSVAAPLLNRILRDAFKAFARPSFLNIHLCMIVNMYCYALRPHFFLSFRQ